MATTYTLIASNTLSSSAASVTFSAIPNTFTDLVLKCSTRSTRSNTINLIELNINNLTTAIYSSTRLGGTGSAANSQRTSNASYYNGLEYGDADSATANTFANFEIYIPDYLSSNNKPFGTYICQENNTSAAYMTAGAGLWRSTNPITNIKLTDANAESFVSGSSFFLYGIKNS